MLETFKRWFFKPKQPKVWALRNATYPIWNKVVSHSKPVGWLYDHVQGPFRSEMDCEEFCDRANTFTRTREVPMYSDVKVQNVGEK